jgi:hypothetical protein
MNRAFFVLLLAFTTNVASAQTNRIDVVRPDAPELAAFGAHDIGVRTLVVTDSGRPDILNARTGEPVPIYDRSLTVEVWYPAALAPGQMKGTEYTTITRNPDIMATLTGRAVRDAPASGVAPLVPKAAASSSAAQIAYIERIALHSANRRRAGESRR